MKPDLYTMESCRELAKLLLMELHDSLNIRTGTVTNETVRHAVTKSKHGQYGSMTLVSALNCARRGGLALAVYAEHGDRWTIRSREDALRYLLGPVTNALYRRYNRTTGKTLEIFGLSAVFRSYHRARRNLPKLDNFIKIIRLAGFLNPHWTKPED